MKRWFGPKVIGFGIGPRSWEGWLATLIYAGGAILMAFGVHRVLPRTPVWAFEGPWLALFFLIVALTYRRNPEEN